MTAKAAARRAVRPASKAAGKAATRPPAKASAAKAAVKPPVKAVSKPAPQPAAKAAAKPVAKQPVPPKPAPKPVATKAVAAAKAAPPKPAAPAAKSAPRPAPDPTPAPKPAAAKPAPVPVPTPPPAPPVVPATPVQAVPAAPPKRLVPAKPPVAANANAAVVAEAPAAPPQPEFVVGDYVVYPTHGVGRVTGIVNEEIAGHRLTLIVVEFEENRMVLRVPVAKAKTAGLRKLSSRKAIDLALSTLKGRARVKRTMWSRRAQEYEAKINSGDPIAIAEVVRDLHRNAGQPDQSFSERQIYEQAMDRLAAELAAIEQVDKPTAAAKLATVLKAA